MRTMKTINGIIIALTAEMLLTAGVSAAVTAVSVEASLDTRSYTMDWSEERTLNTKEIVGTLLLVR